MLTIIIPTHGRPILLKRTLESLTLCELPRSYRELLVVENGSREGAEEVVASLPANFNATYLHFEQGNKSAALNYALTKVEDDLIVFFDDDVRLDPDILLAYDLAARERTSCFFGGPIDIDYEKAPLEWIKLPPSASGWSLPSSTIEWSKPDFLGFNWAAFSEDIKRVGGFDTAVGPGGSSGGRGQETDMQVRLLQDGMLGIYVPTAKVWHYVPEDRCSPKWSLSRAYQNAITVGYKQNKVLPSLWGYPRWTLLETMKRLCYALLSSLSLNQRLIYEKWYEYYLIRGFMEGQRRRSS